MLKTGLLLSLAALTLSACAPRLGPPPPYSPSPSRVTPPPPPVEVLRPRV